MNIINKSKLTLLSVALLSIPALASNEQYLTQPGSDCKAYYAGQQNRINLYSGTIQAKSTVRVICPIAQIKRSTDGLNEFIQLNGRNRSGKTPICNIIETGRGGYKKWTKLPILSTNNNAYFQINKVYKKRSQTSALSISCVLSTSDSITSTDSAQR